MTKARVCFIDKNGRHRTPRGRYATLADIKRVNARRIRFQLARWKGVRVK